MSWTELLDENGLLKKVIALLDSGDDTGCDDLVVVGLREFIALRDFVHQLTGEKHGNISQEDVQG